MKKLFLTFLTFLVSLSSAAADFTNEYKSLIKKYDVPVEAREVGVNMPDIFWYTALSNDAPLVKFKDKLFESKGLMKNVLVNRANLPHFRPRFDPCIIDEYQGFCDTLGRYVMGLPGYGRECSVHVLYSDDMNTFISTTENGFAICLTSGIVEREDMTLEMLMGYVAHEYAHGVLMHIERRLHSKAKAARVGSIAIGVMGGFLAGGLTGMSSLGVSTVSLAFRENEDSCYYQSPDSVYTGELIKILTASEPFKYTPEQVFEADMYAYRYMENIGCADDYLRALMALGPEYEKLCPSHYPSISKRINFLRYMAAHPELRNVKKSKKKNKKSKKLEGKEDINYICEK